MNPEARTDYSQHNTNYRALISKYVGAGGGEARTATDVSTSGEGVEWGMKEER